MSQMIEREKAIGLRLRNKTYSVDQIEAALTAIAPLENYIVDEVLVTFFCPQHNCWMIDMNDDEAFNTGARHYLEVIGAPTFTNSEDAEEYMERWTPNVSQ